MSKTRLFRGISVPTQYYSLVRHMLQVDDFRESLRDLKATWDSLSLLAQLTGIGTDVGETRTDFNKLTENLILSLMEESVQKVVDSLGAKAQVSIDIVVRNLFERTADIGFLATDANIVTFLEGWAQGQADQSVVDTLQCRFAAYVEKYSVYSNVILLSPLGEVLAQLDSSHHPVGFVTNDPLVQATLSASASYTETFRASELDPSQKQTLIYSAPVRGGDSKVLGVLCLVFRFDNEMEGIFSDLSSQANSTEELDWSVMVLVDEDGHVIASNKPWQVPVGMRLDLVLTNGWKVIQCGGSEYLAVTRRSHGYQGYLGPQWLGHVMIPVQYAFLEESDGAQDEGIRDASYLVSTSGLFSEGFEHITDQADQIQKHLNRSVWNGNLQRDAMTRAFSESFLKILLQEISNTGSKTRDVFSRSIAKLNETVLSRFLATHRFIAGLAIDIMDRNLYERANDCRWWALTRDFRELLSKPKLELQDQHHIHHILSYVHSLYTVYSNLIVFDTEGRVVGSSVQPELLGEVLNQEWVTRCLALMDERQYVVSSFQATPLYANQPTYVYAAAILHPQCAQVVGGIAIVFDSAPQFEGMLVDSLPPNNTEGDQKYQGFFVDQNLSIIASNHLELRAGDRLTFPELEAVLSSLSKGEGVCKILEKDGFCYSVGVCASGGYREFKGDLDAYQACVYAVVMRKLAPKQVMVNETLTRNQPMVSVLSNPQELGIELATFTVNQQVMAVLAEDAVEAIDKPKMISLPNAPYWVAGMGVYRSETIMVVDIAALFGQQTSIQSGTFEQVIIVKRKRLDGSDGVFGLLVHDLGGVYTIGQSLLVDASHIFNETNGLIQKLAKINDGILPVLSVHQLNTMLEAGNSLSGGQHDLDAMLALM